MSLINQMLRDLEARRGGVAQAHDTVLEGLSSAGVWTGPAARPLPWVVLAATGVIAAMLLLVPLPGGPPQTITRSAPSPRADLLPTSVAAPSSPVRQGLRPAAGDPDAMEDPAMAAAPPVQITTELRALAWALEVPWASGLADPERKADGALPVAREPSGAKETATVAPVNRGDAFAHAGAGLEMSGADAAIEDVGIELPSAGGTIEHPGSFRREQVVLAAPTGGDVELARALNLLAGGQTDRGLKALRAYVLGHPHALAARARYARELLKAGRGTEAEAVLRLGLKLTPGAADLARLLAHRLFDAGEPAGALRVLLGAAPPVAADPEYHAFVAALHQQSGDHAAAVAVYRDILALQRDNGSAWLGLGISLAAGNAPGEARTAFRQALSDSRLSPAIREFARQEAARLEQAR